MNQSSIKELTIIIVTYNSSLVIQECLQSFDNNLYEVFVVDNASSDNTLEIVKNNFPQVKIIANHKNIGFGRANNLVLKKCQTPYALVLNPDAKIRDCDLKNSLAHLKNNSQIALASPKVINHIEFDDKLMELHNPIQLQHFIVGGVLFINIENVKKLDFFDEQFFMFAEDSDLSDRSILAGFHNAILTMHWQFTLARNQALNHLKPPIYDSGIWVGQKVNTNKNAKIALISSALH